MDCNIILQSTTKSLPNSPRLEINRESNDVNRTFFTLNDIYQAEQKDRLGRLDKYLEEKTANYVSESPFRIPNRSDYRERERRRYKSSAPNKAPDINSKKESTKSEIEPYLPTGFLLLLFFFHLETKFLYNLINRKYLIFLFNKKCLFT